VLQILVQVLEDNNPRNTTAPRSIGAIALSISPNDNGYYCFMNLTTGRVLTQQKYVKLPITNTVIAQVESLAMAVGQSKIKQGCPTFGWTPDKPIIFNEENDDDNPDEDYDNDDFPDKHHDDEITDDTRATQMMPKTKMMMTT
jgi:hypothetical protein